MSIDRISSAELAPAVAWSIPLPLTRSVLCILPCPLLRNVYAVEAHSKGALRGPHFQRRRVPHVGAGHDLAVGKLDLDFDAPHVVEVADADRPAVPERGLDVALHRNLREAVDGVQADQGFPLPF